MFNKELYKSNKKYLWIAIALIWIVMILNIFISNDIFSELSNGGIKINQLVINEIMSSNKASLVDENGNLCDWVEIYNGYNYSINLKNYSLSDQND